jgi:hypothetical protein
MLTRIIYKYSYESVILIILQLISYGDASPCIFTWNIHSNKRIEKRTFPFLITIEEKYAYFYISNNNNNVNERVNKKKKTTLRAQHGLFIALNTWKKWNNREEILSQGQLFCIFILLVVYGNKKAIYDSSMCWIFNKLK